MKLRFVIATLWDAILSDTLVLARTLLIELVTDTEYEEDELS